MNKKIVIMMYGYPATGKTFISKKLINSLKEKYSIVGVATLDFRKKLNLFDLKSEEQRNLVYDSLVEYMDSLKNQDIVIVDGNFNKRHRREKLYSILKERDIYVIKCVVSDEKVIEERMKERQEKLHIYTSKAATMELYNMIKESGDDIERDELVKKELVNLIQFNSEKNIVEKVNLNKNNVQEVTKAILFILEN